MLSANVCAGFIRICYGVCGNGALDILGAPRSPVDGERGTSFTCLPPLVHGAGATQACLPLDTPPRAEVGWGIVFVAFWECNGNPN